MTRSLALAAFSRHEFRLAWRDWLGMLRAGRRGRAVVVVVVLVLFAVALHLIAFTFLSPYAGAAEADVASRLALTGSAFLAWTLMLSQAMEAVTRAFYTRADLDLILSSPASPRMVFAIRVGAIAATTMATSVLLLGPFVNVAAALVSPRFLAAYGVLGAMACAATALALALTALLFRLVGPKRTRLLAQIVAAVVGAGFVIGVQTFAILSTGSLSRLALFRSPAWIAAAPPPDSPLWWPALAAAGDIRALVVLVFGALALLAVVVAMVGGSFARMVVAAAGVAQGPVAQRGGAAVFRPRSRAQTLRRKEWVLLARDPWLVSQSLMQVLYLVPPALLLWRNFGADAGSLVVLAPVLVMAAGQLAGGLAWLAISGEDAPDLVATAPLTPAAMLRAKIEAVMTVVALPILPLAAAIALVSPWIAATTLIGAALAAGAATTVQIFFKAQAKRTQFRRRQTSSRVATFAEAFISISIAGAAGLGAAGSWLALVPLAFAALTLMGARTLAPRAA